MCFSYNITVFEYTDATKDGILDFFVIHKMIREPFLQTFYCFFYLIVIVVKLHLSYVLCYPYMWVYELSRTIFDLLILLIKKQLIYTCILNSVS